MVLCCQYEKERAEARLHCFCCGVRGGQGAANCYVVNLMRN